MTTYSVIEEGNDGATVRDSVSDLAAATDLAERRARQSAHPVLVRDEDSGREIARFHPGRKASPSERTGEKKRTSDALLKLKAANQRLQSAIASLRKPNDEPK